MKPEKEQAKFYSNRSSLMPYNHACFYAVEIPNIFELWGDKINWSSAARPSNPKLILWLISLLSAAKLEFGI